MKRMPTFLLVVAALFLARPGVAAAAVRFFAVIPFYAPEQMWRLYEPFVEHLRTQTGERWELKLYPGQDAMVAAVCAGEVDVALLGPVPLGRVNRACGATPFLVALARDGRPVYHAMLVTADPAVVSISGLRGRKVGLMRGSTAAHALPVKMLRDGGLAPSDYASVFFESQDKIMTALLSREVSGAGVKETLYRRFAGEQLRLLASSEPLPNFALAALPALPPAVRERFAAALLRLRPLERPADAETTKGWDDEIKHGFVLPAPDFLDLALKTHQVYESTVHEIP